MESVRLCAHDRSGGEIVASEMGAAFWDYARQTARCGAVQSECFVDDCVQVLERAHLVPAETLWQRLYLLDKLLLDLGMAGYSVDGVGGSRGRCVATGYLKMVSESENSHEILTTYNVRHSFSGDRIRLQEFFALATSFFGEEFCK